MIKIFRIRVSKNNEKTAKAAESIYSVIHSTIRNKISPTFSFEIACSDKHIYFYFWCEDKFKHLIISQIYSQYPDIVIDEVPDYFNLKNKKILISAEIVTDNSYIYPIKRHPQFEDGTTKTFLDPLAWIIWSLSTNTSDEILAFQMVFVPLNNSFRDRWIEVASQIKPGFNIKSSKYKKWYTDNLLNSGLNKLFFSLFIKPFLNIFWLWPRSEVKSTAEKSEVEQTHSRETVENAITWKLSQQLFGVNIRFLYTSINSDIESWKNKINNLISSFYQFNIPRFNSFKVKYININKRADLKLFTSRKIHQPFILCTEELATIWHLPDISVNVPNIQWIKSKLIEPPLNLPTESSTEQKDLTILWNTDYRWEHIKFGIKTSDRQRHIYIIWKTWMGKSTILENMIISDILAWKWVAVIDPHWDLADCILSLIPKSRTNDVLIFNPADTDFPVSFNMLECKNPEQRHLVVSGLLWTFKKLFWDSWWPRLEHILRNTLLALTEKKDATLLGVMKMLSDKNYRALVLKCVTDPMVLSFWTDEFGKWEPRAIAENVSPIQNKVWQFLSTKLIRNIFGQPVSSMNLRFAMDKNKIIIVNLSKWKIWEDNSNLLWSMLVTKFQIDAMSRADTLQSKRTDFYLYVDEFQNFATEAFATILSEARKYKLNLTIANQYIDQMSDEVKSAVFGNVWTLISFQVGAEDAKFFSEQFSEEVSVSDIINIPKYSCYMKLLIDGMPSPIFSVKTLPRPTLDIEISDIDKLLKVSREKYAKPREFVESKIAKWMTNPK